VVRKGFEESEVLEVVKEFTSLNLTSPLVWTCQKKNNTSINFTKRR
jgi:hypothetical protein